MAPFVVVHVGQKRAESGVQRRTSRPRWEERFDFEVHNLYATDIRCDLHTKAKKLKGSEDHPILGRVVIPLASLDLDEPLDDWYLLNSGVGTLRVQLELTR